MCLIQSLNIIISQLGLKKEKQGEYYFHVKV